MKTSFVKTFIITAVLLVPSEVVSAAPHNTAANVNHLRMEQSVYADARADSLTIADFLALNTRTRSGIVFNSLNYVMDWLSTSRDETGELKSVEVAQHHYYSWHVLNYYFYTNRDEVVSHNLTGIQQLLVTLGDADPEADYYTVFMAFINRFIEENIDRAPSIIAGSE